jgi:hypothetical protein
MRRRAAVEPVIGHLQGDHRMGRNHPKGHAGDRAHAILAAAGYNFSLLLRWLKELLRALLAKLTGLSKPAPTPEQIERVLTFPTSELVLLLYLTLTRLTPMSVFTDSRRTLENVTSTYHAADAATRNARLAAIKVAFDAVGIVVIQQVERRSSSRGPGGLGSVRRPRRRAPQRASGLGALRLARILGRLRPLQRRAAMLAALVEGLLEIAGQFACALLELLNQASRFGQRDPDLVGLLLLQLLPRRTRSGRKGRVMRGGERSLVFRDGRQIIAGRG